MQSIRFNVFFSHLVEERRKQLLEPKLIIQSMNNWNELGMKWDKRIQTTMMKAIKNDSGDWVLEKMANIKNSNQIISNLILHIWFEINYASKNRRTKRQKTKHSHFFQWLSVLKAEREREREHHRIETIRSNSNEGNRSMFFFENN